MSKEHEKVYETVQFLIDYLETQGWASPMKHNEIQKENIRLREALEKIRTLLNNGDAVSEETIFRIANKALEGGDNKS